MIDDQDWRNQWESRQIEDSSDWEVIDGAEYQRAVCDNEEDAQLIAAAPELLISLKELISVIMTGEVISKDAMVGEAQGLVERLNPPSASVKDSR